MSSAAEEEKQGERVERVERVPMVPHTARSDCDVTLNTGQRQSTTAADEVADLTAEL